MLKNSQIFRLSLIPFIQYNIISTKMLCQNVGKNMYSLAL